MTALRRVEAWAEYTTALSRAIEEERSAVGDSLAAARDRVNGLLWTTPEGYAMQEEYKQPFVSGNKQAASPPFKPTGETPPVDAEPLVGELVLLTSEGLAEALRVTSATVRRWVRTKRLKPTRITYGGYYEFDLDDAKRQLDSMRFVRKHGPQR